MKYIHVYALSASLLQVYANESRWTARGIALALPLFYGGQILLTYPLGWMADRTARRYVLIGMSAVAIVCMGTMALQTRSSEAWAITFLMGGFATVTYTLGLAILGQQFKSDALLSVNAAYLALSWLIESVDQRSVRPRVGDCARPVQTRLVRGATPRYNGCPSRASSNGRNVRLTWTR